MMQVMVDDTVIRIAAAKIPKLMHDPEASAKAVNLVYVSDSEPGILRVKNKNTFRYLLNSKPTNSAEILARIKALVIPPAWENVWICALENGHIQVTGKDVKGRKQYRYHPLWNALRNETKFYRLLSFGNALPDIRKKLESDLALPGLPKEKVLAAVVSIMDRTSIRIGNGFYEKLYGSFGLSTMKDRHVKIKSGTVQFAFKGKKGVFHEISLKSRKLAKIVRQCRDIPGKELFQYIDTDGKRSSIDSGDVNQYIKDISGDFFTSKDFRTWAGTVQFLWALKDMEAAETKKAISSNAVKALDMVAAALGNTRAVCKKHYVHPSVMQRYESGTLTKHLQKICAAAGKEDCISVCEEELLRLLKKL